ncbi:MAG: hypothetical protein H9535_00490 [Ignavibacteria bacterium]|nr:hypothetical protein [Ignavibacteria bacterium]
MPPISVILVGEDAVTRAVGRRLLAYTCGSSVVVEREEPIRGGQIKQRIPQFNALAAFQPVVMILDADTNCPVELLKSVLQKQEKHPHFFLRIAKDEAESWLLADREGFATYLRIPVSSIPFFQAEKKRFAEKGEITTPYKPSLFIMKELAPQSKNKELRTQLEVNGTAQKSKEYNVAMLPFVEQYWDIDNSLANSYTLRKAVAHLRTIV